MWIYFVLKQTTNWCVISTGHLLVITLDLLVDNYQACGTVNCRRTDEHIAFRDNKININDISVSYFRANKELSWYYYIFGFVFHKVPIFQKLT